MIIVDIEYGVLANVKSHVGQYLSRKRVEGSSLLIFTSSLLESFTFHRTPSVLLKWRYVVVKPHRALTNFLVLVCFRVYSSPSVSENILISTVSRLIKSASLQPTPFDFQKAPTRSSSSSSK